jgi:hypothetical protein
MLGEALGVLLGI